MRWSDLDAYGHVNHTAILAIAEQARIEWLDAELGGGRPWDHVLVRLEVDYRAEVSLADRRLTCSFCVLGMGRTSVRLKERIEGRAETPAAELATVIVAWNSGRHAPRALGAEEREALRLLSFP